MMCGVVSVFVWLALVWCVGGGEAGGGGVRPRCGGGGCAEGGAAPQLNEFYYTVDGEDFLVSFKEGDYLKAKCSGNVTLLSPSLPRFPHAARLKSLAIDACFPHNTAFRISDFLISFNISVIQKLKLDRLPNLSPLTKSTFENVPITSLCIIGAGYIKNKNFSSGYLLPLDQLNDLELDNYPIDDIKNLPATLKRLRVRRSSPLNLTAAALERISNLTWLILQDTPINAQPSLQVALQEAPNLRSIALNVDTNSLPMWSHLENATFFRAKDLKFGGACSSLKLLNINNAPGFAAEKWLGNCSSLETLVLWRVPNALKSKLAEGTSLRVISARRCSLLELPADLLVGADKLQELDLSDNLLEFLPTGIFAGATSLKALRLSGNKFQASNILPLLAPLGLLEALHLDRNPLGNLCSTADDFLANDVSPLRVLSSLQTLVLSRCGVSRVCADWRRDLRRLTDLQLNYNNITELHYDDLQWTRDATHPTTVDLGDNPLTGVVYNYDDYKLAMQSTDTNQYTEFTLTSTPAWLCTCTAYWYERARRALPPHAARLPPSPCHQRPLEELTCPVEECAANCSCRERLAGTDGEVSGAGVIAVCSAAAGGRLPRVPRARDLTLRNSDLADLRAEDMWPELLRLDIRNNSIRSLSAAAAAALVARRARLGARLRCQCGVRPALLLLNAHAAQIEDYEDLTCEDGRRLSEVHPDSLCAGAGGAVWGAAGGGVALLLAIAVLIVLVLRRSLVYYAKKTLVKLGFCLEWAQSDVEPDDDALEEAQGGWQYDVFVSFAHADETRATALVARLESAGWRACVHYRDWAPGELIPAHIAASVRNARRTILLLSEHFARSDWARAEAAAALAQAASGRGRVLPVLLAEDTPDALPRDLIVYLQSATYLRWDDPWFWDKLTRAMPRRPLAAMSPEKPPGESAGAA